MAFLAFAARTYAPPPFPKILKPRFTQSPGSGGGRCGAGDTGSSGAGDTGSSGADSGGTGADSVSSEVDPGDAGAFMHMARLQRTSCVAAGTLVAA